MPRFSENRLRAWLLEIRENPKIFSRFVIDDVTDAFIGSISYEEILQTIKNRKVGHSSKFIISHM